MFGGLIGTAPHLCLTPLKIFPQRLGEALLARVLVGGLFVFLTIHGARKPEIGTCIKALASEPTSRRVHEDLSNNCAGLMRQGADLGVYRTHAYLGAGHQTEANMPSNFLPNPRTIGLAAALVALSTAAQAQTTRPAKRAAPPPAQTGGYSYQSYGLDANCRDRPFANGCDKRGQW